MIHTVDTFDYVAVEQTPCQVRRRGNQGRRYNEKKYKDILAAFDIETTNDDESCQAFMYVWQAQLNDQTVMGRTWDEFLLFLKRLAERLKENEYIVFFIHNLSFEFQFLRGIYNFSQEEVFAMESRKVLKCEMMEHFEFRCSYLQTNMSLAEFTHKMGVADEKLSGEDFDYSKARYPWTELTAEEIHYCVNDVKGLVQAMEKQMELEEDSLYTLPYTSTGYVRRDCRAAMRHFNWYDLKMMLPDYDVFCMLREAFRGGNTHANRYYSGLIMRDVKSYDRSSSYPDVMVNRLFPMGPWMKDENVDMNWVLRRIYRHHRACLMRVKFFNVRLTDPGWGAPYLAKAKCRNVQRADIDNGRILSADYLETTITDVDFKIIMEEYTFDYMEVTDFYHARYGKLPLQLRNCILSYYNDKTSLKGIPEQELYYMKQKNKLNSIYGMSVQSPVKQTIDFLNDFIERNEDEQELLEKANSHAFLSYAWGCWVTALAREELEQAIKLAGDGFIYCDTDSVKYIGDADFSALNERLRRRSKENGASAMDPKGKVHYLGVWEKESKGDFAYRTFKTLGAKKYVFTDEDGKVGVTIAGVNKKKGAEELASRGGVTAFRPGFVFRTAGGLESVYNDNPPMSELIREGRSVPITSNVYMRDSEYTVGITGDYMRILERAQDWKLANEKN